MRKLVRQLHNVPRALALVWAAAPRWTTFWLIMLVVQGLLPIATVYLTRALVNDLVLAIRSAGAWPTVRPVLIVAAWMGVCLLAAELLKSLAAWVRSAQSELIRDHITALIHKKSATADLAFFESPDFFDHLYLVSSEARHRPLGVLENLGSLLQNGITLLAMGAILLPFGPVLPLALVVSTLPALYVVICAGQRRHDFTESATASERQTSYYDWLLTSRDAAAELRLFGLADHFQSAYKSLRVRLRNDRLRLERKQGFAELGAGLCALIATGAAMAWMIWRAVLGLVTVGDLALFYQAYNQGLGLVRTLLQNVGQLYENTLFLDNLFQFLALEHKVVNPPAPVSAPLVLREGLRFSHVTFSYPNSDRTALKDFNLTLKHGQIAAIVGPNGAGKSTLIKLLCRFYDPDDGAITIDGTPLSHFSLEELRARITALFQSPIHYEATAAQNIAFGDLGASNIDSIRTAAIESGADPIIQKLSRTYDTQLGKWFMAGTDLSLGEWQRVAMARAFTRKAPIIILDEPTSAMDPWAEMQWAEHFREIVRGRTALLITHRFTTAMFADVIHVVSEGQVVESGTHDELLALGALYAQGWSRQRTLVHEV